jgi:catechol-2,3-dioxygenase
MRIVVAMSKRHDSFMKIFSDCRTKSGRRTKTLHAFFQMDDGSFLAFFEVPEMPFDFKQQHDYDLHIALEVEPDALHEMFEKGKSTGIETRGVADHGFIDSIYFRDPNGYVIELTAKRSDHDEQVRTAGRSAHNVLEVWQKEKPASA